MRVVSFPSDKRCARAKGLTMRHEYGLAMADLERVKDLEPWNSEAEDDLRRLKKVMQRDRKEEKELYQGIFHNK